MATLLPSELLGMFGQPDLLHVAEEVEKAIKAMMDSVAAG